MKRLDRRALFASGAAAALLAAAGLTLSAPRRGGRLRIAVARETGSLDRIAAGAMYESLTEVAPDGVLKGALATDWHSRDGARVWMLALRDGVSFHDGSALSATDVRDALDLPGARIETTSALGLRIELDAPDAQLPFRLAEVPIRKASGAGTGLYAPQRHQPGRSFLGHRRAQHWKDGEAGWVEAVEVIAIPDAGVRAEALREGYVDVAERPAAVDLSGVRYLPTDDDIVLAVAPTVGVPPRIGGVSEMDGGRIAERWWIA